VIELVIDAGTSGGASEASTGFTSSVSARGATRQQLTADLDGYSSPLKVNGRPGAGPVQPAVPHHSHWVTSVVVSMLERW
jgi:hypothetical protein